MQHHCRTQAIGRLLLICYKTLWPFDLEQWPYMAGHVINPSMKDPSLLELWGMTSTTGHHWQRLHPLRMRHKTWPVCRGKDIFHIFEMLPGFVYPHYNLRCSIINRKHVICQNSALVYVKGHTALCACIKSREPWMGGRKLHIWNAHLHFASLLYNFYRAIWRLSVVYKRDKGRNG